VGKTHLSIALSHVALKAGNSIYFTTLAKMATDLRNFPTKKRLSKYLSPKVLVIDEIGYRPVDESASSLFFDIVSERYEKGSIIASSNKPFSEWGNIFNDSILATAILDRLLHHATVVNIKGDSYRLKDRKKQGVFTHVEVAENKEKGDVR